MKKNLVLIVGIILLVVTIVFAACDIEIEDDNGEKQNVEFQLNVVNQTDTAAMTGVVTRIARVPGGGYVYKLKYEGNEYLITHAGRCIIPITPKNEEVVEIDNSYSSSLGW